jgi:hypothetical protein
MPREKIAINPSDRASRMSCKLVETLGANRTITLAEIERYNGFAFDPGGSARDVTLPAVAACKGVIIFISNQADAAEVLTVKNSGGSAIVTPTQAEAALLWCDGVTWYGLVGAQS